MKNQLQFYKTEYESTKTGDNLFKLKKNAQDSNTYLQQQLDLQEYLNKINEL